MLCNKKSSIGSIDPIGYPEVSELGSNLYFMSIAFLISIELSVSSLIK